MDISNSKTTIGLAPMEGATDFPTRIWFSQTSRPDFCASPFLRVTETYPTAKLSDSLWPELSIAKDAINYQFVPQIMANDAGHFVRVADSFRERTNVVELNCGCPASKVVGHGSGSSLLMNNKKFRDFTKTIASQLEPGTLSVKMRTGYTADDEFDSLVEAVEDLPLRQLVVHGRTRIAQYQGRANWELIEKAAKRLTYPVVGSGDITDLQSFRAIRAAAPTPRNFIVGRGALRNPWLFEELRSGNKVEVGREVILHALTALLHLYQLDKHHPQALARCLQNECWRDTCSNDLKKWQSLLRVLCKDLPEISNPLSPPGITRPALGRMKLHWNYLRSSLAPSAMEPKIMREQTWDGFLAAIKRSLPERMLLTYRPEWDWIYAGEKRPPNTKPCRTL